MSKKKILLILVEGASDQTALEGSLKQFFDMNTVKTYILHGDITTRTRTMPQNVVRKIEEEIQHFCQRNFLNKTDICRLIQVVDMDGAYIPDDHIIEKEDIAKVQYTEDGIFTRSKEDIVRRNQQKRSNLDRLQQCSQISKIPYQVYYMSCNLDHALYGKLNLTDQEKEDQSYEFAAYYENHLEEFMRFIRESDFSVQKEYKESWEFIRQDLNSLRRHTNLGLCLYKL